MFEGGVEGVEGILNKVKRCNIGAERFPKLGIVKWSEAYGKIENINRIPPCSPPP